MKKVLLTLVLIVSVLGIKAQAPTFEEIQNAFKDLMAYKETLLDKGYVISYYDPVAGNPDGGSYILEYELSDGGYTEVDTYDCGNPNNNEILVYFYGSAKSLSIALADGFNKNATEKNEYYCEHILGYFNDYEFYNAKGRKYTDPDLNHVLVFEYAKTLFDCEDYKDF